MIKRLFFIVYTLSASLFLYSTETEGPATARRIVANPLNLNYRFQWDEPSRREAADPVLEFFKGKYYLFASKSGGYWSSPDMADWTYIPCTSIGSIEAYAPTIMEHNGMLYYMASERPRFFRTAAPDEDNWEELESKFPFGVTDPAFFKDEGGKVYLYWGCSDKDPIMGVQVDPDDGFRALGEPVVLIKHRIAEHGWENPGHNNEENKNGWNEGPCMIRHNGKYYLHYAAPGTQFRVYGDGVYTSDNPLGPYTYAEYSPFSFKPGGFMGGAGHGHTFKDRYGNYWHVATTVISVRHMFERRIGLFPVYMDGQGGLHAHTVFSDYPYRIPGSKVDFSSTNCSMNWNLLSYTKAVSTSSAIPTHPAGYANDEKIETWWSAASGRAGEWWQVDLGRKMDVHAIQVNFADQDFTVKAPESYVFYQYKIECSDDGSRWRTFADRTANTADMPHELIVPEAPAHTRYLRITNTRNMEGKFSMSGFRVFGKAGVPLPGSVRSFTVRRDAADRRIIRLRWEPLKGATGYILRWGIRKDRLHNAAMVYDTNFEGRFFNRDSEYYFSVEAFNEAGTGNKINK